MERKLTICFTSDMHGYFSPTRYSDQSEAAMGLMKLMDAYPRDGNTLILDGGDTLQGSPLTNYYQRLTAEQRRGVLADDTAGNHPVAAMMNLAGYHYVTLGNHDFNYGLAELGDYLQNLDALCLCANIRDRAGRLPIAPYAIHRLENGLRVGITGVCTHYVSRWEDPATVQALEIEDAFTAAERTLAQMKGQCDLTVLLYHGGYECDLTDGRALSSTGENQACRICRDLDYDLVLTGHQHLQTPLMRLGNSWTMQPTYRAPHACKIDVILGAQGMQVSGEWIEPLEKANPEAMRILAPLEARVQRWLDTPTGHLSQPLPAQDHLSAAVQGSPLANFVNQVQRFMSGAQVSTCALANEYKGLPLEVTIRDVVSTYIYSNTLLVLSMDRAQLRRYMERSACYLALSDEGRIELGETFTRPKMQHYNYDYFSGVDYVVDLRYPPGERVRSIRLNGRELGEAEQVSVCVNSYRYGGTSGYEMVSEATVLREVQLDVADAIIEYIAQNPHIEVDMHRYCTLLPEQGAP